MRWIDGLRLKHPLCGSRMLSFTLRRESRLAFRKRVQRLLRIMGIESTAQGRPRASLIQTTQSAFVCFDADPFAEQVKCGRPTSRRSPMKECPAAT